MNTPRSIKLRFAFLAALTTAWPLHADWKDEIGYTRLQLLAGGELPTAPSNGYTQAEAPDGANNYAPETTDTNFSGRVFSLKSGTSSANEHAQAVATNFYGNATSLLPGNAAVDLYNANNWIGAGFLGATSSDVPLTESRAVQNHSWISASGNTESLVVEINERLDYAINLDGFVSVIGVNNGSSTTLPQLLAQSYHTISVGLSNGGHSAGFTTLDGSGRIKPDIVAPDTLTSFATPMVSSAAGLLYAKLAATPYSLTGADRPRVIKALLQAGATKDTVSSWANTSSRPLDLVYGAGELNVYNAYATLRSGRAAASDSVSVPSRAWAAESVAAGSTKTYYFTVPAGFAATPFCAALNWHRVITTSTSGGGPFRTRTWSSSLADLNLRLYTASSFSLGTLIAESASTVDNVELVYQSALAPGSYALVVENLSTTATPYALAWHTRPSVSVTATTTVARESDGQAGIVTITRTGDTTLPLLVNLSAGGTAVPGTHYQALPATITIAAGQASTTVPVTPVGDSLAQGDRTVTIAIAADFSLVRNPAQVASVTIQDKPFDAWRFTRFTTEELADSAISGDSADPDADGISNLLEYALGTEPKSPNTSTRLPTPAIDNARLTLTYTRPTTTTDLSYTLEWSDNLSTWHTGPEFTELISSTDNGNGTITVFTRAVSSLSTAPRQFLRLRVTR
ncbi:MAG: hypothetical protein H7Y06_09710 [Opitutaceae bacterium]|nr:hypothetical protein [Opitutaceae bacterium]